MPIIKVEKYEYLIILTTYIKDNNNSKAAKQIWYKPNIRSLYYNSSPYCKLFFQVVENNAQ